MGPEQQWRDALGSGRLMFQRAIASGRVFYPPRSAEPGTGDEGWEWVEASGDGIVYSVTVVWPRNGEPYNVALIDLAEGPRLMSRVDGVAPEAVRIGMAVRARIEGAGEDALLLFDAP